MGFPIWQGELLSLDFIRLPSLIILLIIDLRREDFHDTAYKPRHSHP